ncbi:hypothetical protein PM082_024650 [Marasmius tenuissimus]|nr:hypothetical protein PM082_024650 [Marasmius tenuissimus]
MSAILCTQYLPVPFLARSSSHIASLCPSFWNRRGSNGQHGLANPRQWTFPRKDTIGASSFSLRRQSVSTFIHLTGSSDRTEAYSYEKVKKKGSEAFIARRAVAPTRQTPQSECLNGTTPKLIAAI